MNLAMNTLASLYYSRLYTLGLVIVTILTVVVGSKGVANLINDSVTAVNVVLSCCDIALGITAALLTNLELKTKAERYHRRACGYSLMSSQLQLDMCIEGDTDVERARLRATLHTLPERLSELEQHADPLPLRYRIQAQTMPHALFYSTNAEDDAADAVTVAAASAHYAEAHEREGSKHWSASQDTDIIMSQTI